MRILCLLLSWLLIVQPLWSADYVTIRSGNWHDAGAGTTPIATGSCAVPVESALTPGAGDRLTICNTHALACEAAQTCTIGLDDTTTGYAIRGASATGTGILNNYGTFVYRGVVEQPNAVWTSYPGSTITHGSAASNYAWEIGQSANPSAARLVLAGDGWGAGHQVTVNTDGTKSAGFVCDYGGGCQSGAGLVTATYTEIQADCGVSSATRCLYARPGVSGQTYSLTNVKFASPAKLTFGGLSTANGIVDGTTLHFENVTIDAPLSATASIEVWVNAAKTTGDRSLTNVVLNGGAFWVTSGVTDTGFVIDNLLADAASQPINFVDGKQAYLQDSLITLSGSGASGNGLPGGGVYRLLAWNNCSGSCGGSDLFRWTTAPQGGIVVDGFYAGGTANADDSFIVQGDTTVAASVFAFRNGVIDGTVGHEGIVAYDGSTYPNSTFQVNNITIGPQSATTSNLVNLHDGTGTGTATFEYIKNNLLWRSSAGAAKAVLGGTQATASTLNAANYNGTYNITYSGYTDIYVDNAATDAYDPDPPGANDTKDVDPQFVDTSCTLLSFCQRIDATVADTAACIAKFHKLNDTDWDSRYDVRAAYNYLTSCKRPRNPTIRTAGEAGTYLGGVDPDFAYSTVAAGVTTTYKWRPGALANQGQ